MALLDWLSSIGEASLAKQYCELSLYFCGRLKDGRSQYEQQIRHGYAQILAELE
jgi:hypothetical protein